MIDLDLILYGNLIEKTDQLDIPSKDIEKYNFAGNNARTDAERERHTHVVKWIDEWRAVGSPKGCALPF